MSAFSQEKAQTPITPAAVEKTISAFTELDKSGDKRSMTKMAERLGKEQPAMLQFAAKYREEHGNPVGEAAVFYSTLVWAMFDRHVGKSPRLLDTNLTEAQTIVDADFATVEGISQKPVHERIAPQLMARQPNLVAKLAELIDEDVREKAITEETAAIIFPVTQVVLEAFDAAVTGRRPGERLGPVVVGEKIGRNDPCTCGSGQKYKKCHGKEN